MSTLYKMVLVNRIDPDTQLDYRERVRILRERKLEQTKEKMGIRPYQDGDDYGSILPPEEYTWECIPNHPDGSWYGYEGWSKNFHKLMATHPIFIDPVDAFTCRWMFCMPWLKGRKRWKPELNYDHLKPGIEKYGIVSGIGADSHFGGDYRIGLSLGWGGILRKLEEYRLKNLGHDEFYDAEVMVVKGIQQWIANTIEVTKEAIEQEKHPDLKENLQQMLKVNEWIITEPPRTLREACQWICWFNMASRTYNRDGAGGQLDELLRPYYEADLSAGRISGEDEAKYYIACLLLNDPHYYQIGGLDEHGNDMPTYFSYLILEAADWLNSSCYITVRVHEKTDKRFINKAVYYLFKNKKGWPRFSGDKALCEGFMRKGYPLEIARQRVAVGCHWMSLPGLEYTLNDCVKINCAKIFEIALDEMMEKEKNPTVETLWDYYRKHQRKAVEITAAGIDFHLKNQVKNQPELVLNLICHGPVEKGRDMVDGGAQYYNMCIDGTGIATVADSFAALEQRVEREKRISWQKLYETLKNNFEGVEGEYIRLMLAASERYGGGNSLGDKWGVRISEAFTDDVNSMEQYYPYKFIPGWFSWSNTIQLGKVVGATPNGRKAYEPINHGCNPHPQFRKDGAVTAMSNIICAVQPGYGNTAPIQLELDPGIAKDDEAIQKISDYIMTIMDNGATLLNINIIDKDQILEANKDPSKYPDLVVRVTGFTAYFCLLTPEFRKLVVDRILTA